jgi:hypothetical protein
LVVLAVLVPASCLGCAEADAPRERAAERGLSAPTSAPPSAKATCADFDTQEEAQRAANTRDVDGDGLYCESLPDGPSASRAGDCVRTDAIVDIGISRTRYPAVLAHMRRAVRRGWPRVLTLHRRGAERRRARALAGIAVRDGFDRDEWPMAVGRRSWRTDVEYVPSEQNRGAGARIGVKLRRYCDGVRFRVVGY